MRDMPRPYVQRARDEAAAETRRQVLAAARAAVLADGRLEFGVGEIAAAAGVARSTVYAAFGSRAGLLAALVDETLHRAGLETVIAEYQRPDPVDALDRSLLASCRMYAADHRVFARLLMLRAVDPDAVAPLARSLDDRAIGMASLAERLAAAHRLRLDLPEKQATDVLWVLTSFWTFDELFTGRGLDADGCARILIEMARSTLLVEGDDA
jgi:AcrR family transcriptional regulator